MGHIGSLFWEWGSGMCRDGWDAVSCRGCAKEDWQETWETKGRHKASLFPFPAPWEAKPNLLLLDSVRYLCNHALTHFPLFLKTSLKRPVLILSDQNFTSGSYVCLMENWLQVVGKIVRDFHRVNPLSCPLGCLSTFITKMGCGR